MSVDITDAELAVMKVLWEQSPLNARQITEQLSREKSWHRKTVNTLLSRLEGKSAIAARKHDDGVRYFTPRVDQDSYGQAAATELVDSVFNGELAPLIACFARNRRLSRAQIDQLRQLIEEIDDEDA
ncbi:BlaI/MecI/CopY family transcriptional regulator [Elongatibacter sediminis]|uniref:BlaI/MecI/CopY family transcriptional regulator n=1 Tax=Elongatibacter sediminis TaxID=3119006 RepID=A0AAW9REP4_9GAMM